MRAQRRGRQKVGEDGGGRESGLPGATTGCLRFLGAAMGRRVGDTSASHVARDLSGAPALLRHLASAVGSGRLCHPRGPSLQPTAERGFCMLLVQDWI